MLPQADRVVALRDHLVGWSLVGTGDVRYFLRELIGEGGQGWVFKANYDQPDGMWVVVKILRPDSVNQETLERFHQEAQVLRMLGAHSSPTPSVVRFFDHGIARLPLRRTGLTETVELPFTVLEFIDGVTLHKVLEGPPSKALPVARVRRIFRQVVRALETVHAHRIVHRDLKPSNILLTMQAGQEIAKVTDFGLVKLVDLRLTQTATIAGATLGYAPPEQYEQGNTRVTERTDVFSLGAILFEALAGRTAFPYGDSDNPVRVITRMLTDPRPSLFDDTDQISPELRGQHDLIQKLDAELGRALQPAPENRPATCRLLWNVIEPLLHEAEIRQPNPRSTSLPGSPVSPKGPKRSQSALELTAVGSANMTVAQAPAMSTQLSPPPPIRVLSAPMRGVSIRASIIGADGSVLTVGPSGFCRWSEHAWSCLPPIRGLDPQLVRSVYRTPDGQLLLIGDHGLVTTLTPNGQIDPWPAAGTDVSFLAAWMDSPSEVFLVGQRQSNQRGVVVRLTRTPGGTAQLIEWPVCLRAIARLRNGALVACGDSGTLLHLDLPAHAPIIWERTGHLYAINPRPDGGAAVVGSGGHALLLSSSFDVQLEAVQTTQDLWTVGPSTDGFVWAGGDRGRMLRRGQTQWERAPSPYTINSRIVSLGPTARGLLAVGEDGLILEMLKDP